MFTLLKILLTVYGLCAAQVLWASHNLAGQIEARRVGPNQYELTLTTYTDPFAAGVDRCSAVIEIFSRDGQGNLSAVASTPPVLRANGPTTPAFCGGQVPAGIFIKEGIKKNIYRTVVTLPGPGFYVFRYFDIARQNNVRNMNRPGETAFFVETMVLNSPLDPNSSPVLLNDPLEDACTDRLYTHNPGAFDANGDSLVFSLVNCQQYAPPNIPRPVSVDNFRFPSEFGGAFTIDSETGLVTWDTPQQIGVYNISILVEEYRRGRQVGYLIRDMAIFVLPCINNPPIFNPDLPRDTCVVAGNLLEFEVKVRDPDSTNAGFQFARDSVYFTLNNGGQGFNGPFQEDPPATFEFLNRPSLVRQEIDGFPVRYGPPTAANPTAPFEDPPPAPNPADFIFSWQPGCAQVRRQFYQVDFQAHDDFSNRPELYANHIVKIRVIAPPVENLTAEPASRAIRLNWDAHLCADDVIAYDIYRTNDSTAYADSLCCEEELAGYTYVDRVQDGQATTYLDNNGGEGLPFASRYCYRVRAVFANGSPSCPSDPACETIERNFPVMLIDSVLTTDETAGEIRVSWQPPDFSLINEGFFPPPYTFIAERAVGTAGNFLPVRTSSYDPNTDAFVPDTTFIDAGLNTEVNAYTYRVRMLDDTGEDVEQSENASSIYLSTVGQQDAIRLIWEESVPWENYAYDIYRRSPGEADFSFIATVAGTGSGGGTNQHTYLDTEPELREDPDADNEYCYYVFGRGSYFVDGVTDSLFNASQVRCDEPIDTVPPCLPAPETIQLAGECEDASLLFSWGTPDFLCASDLASWQVYYGERPEDTPRLIFAANNPDLRTYTYSDVGPDGLSGCFYLTATDLRGNESEPSAPLCIDKCPVIQLPNVFTPNGDGFNDLFVPVEYRAIRTIRIQIFSRWGNHVHTSTDINRLWDGLAPNGQPAPEGHYFYILDVVMDDFNSTRFERSGGVTLLR